jgi:hypothetical protein
MKGKAHIREIKLTDMEKKLFLYGNEAIFPADKISVEICALRGPDSNNRDLPDEYKKYDWKGAG